MKQCWNRIPCVKIHLVSSGDIQCHALQWIALYCTRFTEGCPPDLWINAADFAYQKAMMKYATPSSEFFSPHSRVKMGGAVGTLLRWLLLLIGVLLHLLGFALPVTLIIFSYLVFVGCSPRVGVRSACLFCVFIHRKFSSLRKFK